MNARFLALLALLPTSALAQGYAGLGEQATGFTPVTPPAHLSFPADHAPHPGFRIEWWYVTANLAGPDGTAYGAQWTLFRQALVPGPDRPGWESPVVWMGHAAATSAGEHRFAETFARGGIGQAGVTPAPFAAWIDDWSLAGTDIDHLAMRAAGDGFAYDLRLAATTPPVPQGDNGYSLKSPEGQASYYYSQPAYAATGTLTLDGTAIPVTGTAWLDREWSSQPLAPDQTGWDWFALSLASGEKLMLYRFRSRDQPPSLAGTWIADGRPEPLAPDAITLTPTRTETVAGREIPTHWHVAVPSHGLTLDTEPLNAQSWMGTSYAYWEGPIRATGSTSATGYLEMTGY